MGDTVIREVIFPLTPDFLHYDVTKQVAKDVWTFSRPFARYGVFPIGGRSTAVKLRDGGVWVLASTPLDHDTKAKLNELGPVKYIINPDTAHHLYLLEFKVAYPNAKVIGVEDTIQRMNEKSFPFDGLWGRDPPDTQYGFEEDIKYCYFAGFRNKDVAFLHTPSRSLIQADLLYNLPATEQYSKASRWIPQATLKPDSWAHQKVIHGVTTDVEAMKRDAQTVASWEFDRIIPCHGDVIERGGNRAWRAAYKFFID